MTTAEQQARDLLTRMGIDHAQDFTAGDIVELANLIADLNASKRALIEHMSAMALQSAALRERRILTNELMSACRELLEVTKNIEQDTVGEWVELTNAIKRLRSIMGPEPRDDHDA